MQYKTLMRGVGSLLVLTLLSGAVLTAPNTDADSSSTIDITVNVPASCSFTPTSTGLTQTINPGETKEIGTAHLKAVCNDPSGFAIYAVGYTNDEYGNNDLVTGLGDSYSIETGASTSPTSSQWNMTIGNDAISGDHVANIENNFGSDHIVPEAFTKVASFASATDQSIGSNITAKFKAYIAPAQPAGTYQGKVRFVLIHPSTADAPDEFYGVTMQGVAEWGGKVTQGQTITAIDERDGEEYTVARLADGKLWMTKNLRLDFSKLTKTDQELDDLTNGPASGFFTDAKVADMTDPWCTSSNSECINRIQYSTSNINGESCPDGDCDEYGAYYNWYTATAGNGLYSMESYANAQGDICPSGWHLPSGTYTGVGSPDKWTGDYWVLAAGLAGIDTLNIQNSDYDAITSITNKDRFLASPANFNYSGYWAYNSSYSRGSYAYYWSSTYYSNVNAYALHFYQNQQQSFSPGYYNNGTSKFLGYPVRCVANTMAHPLTIHYDEHTTSILVDGQVVADGGSIMLTENTEHSIIARFNNGYGIDAWSADKGLVGDVSKRSTTYRMAAGNSMLSVSSKTDSRRYMQDVAQWGNSIEDGQTVTAFDYRDDSEYTVARLADGKLWMTKNLRLNLESADITAENTNSPASDFLTAVREMPKTSTTTWCNSTSQCDRIEYSTVNLNNSDPIDSNGHTRDDIGVYYNWYTATAGNGLYSTPVYTPVQGDICPSGWRLPTSNQPNTVYAGEFYDLAVALNDGVESGYNSAANAGRMLSSPNSFILGGSVHSYNGNIYFGGISSQGAYWTAIKRDNTHIYYWYLGTSDMHLNNYGDGQINYGNTIRCLAD